MATILLSLIKVCSRLHRIVRLRAAIGGDQLHLLAEHALRHLGRDCLDQRMAFVDVLDGKLHALEFVFALRRIGAGARHSGADGHRRPFRAGRPGPDRRLVGSKNRHGERHRHEAAAGQTGADLQQSTAGHANPLRPRVIREFGIFIPPDVSSVSTCAVNFFRLGRVSKLAVRLLLTGGVWCSPLALASPIILTELRAGTRPVGCDKPPAIAANVNATLVDSCDK